MLRSVVSESSAAIGDRRWSGGGSWISEMRWISQLRPLVFDIDHIHHDSNAKATTASITYTPASPIDSTSVDRPRECAGTLSSESPQLHMTYVA